MRCQDTERRNNEHWVGNRLEKFGEHGQIGTHKHCFQGGVCMLVCIQCGIMMCECV